MPTRTNGARLERSRYHGTQRVLVDVKLEQVCPYCARPILERSRDHVFPDFLGGARTVIACKPCNDAFGLDFEARTASAFNMRHVFLSGCGLTLAVQGPRVRNVGTLDGKMVDLRAGPGYAIVSPSAPVLPLKTANEERIGEFRTIEEVRNFQKQNPHLNLTVERKQTEAGKLPMTMPSLTGPDFQRLSLKMCIALSRLAPILAIEETSAAREALCSGHVAPTLVRTAWDDYPLLDAQRLDFAHAIYIERGEENTYGVVQFFGAYQHYCELGVSAKEQSMVGFLGTLDPLTGDESFVEIAPLNLPKPPSHRWTYDIPRLVEHWTKKFRDAAIKRGATANAAEFECAQISLMNAPRFTPAWESGTFDFFLSLTKKPEDT